MRLKTLQRTLVILAKRGRPEAVHESAYVASWRTRRRPDPYKAYDRNRGPRWHERKRNR